MRNPEYQRMNIKKRDELKTKKAPGPGKLPPTLSSKYPEDDPDYYVPAVEMAEAILMTSVAIDYFRILKEDLVDHVTWDI